MPKNLLLGTSLAANLLLAGWLIFSPRPQPAAPDAVPAGFVRPITEGVPGDPALSPAPVAAVFSAAAPPPIGASAYSAPLAPAGPAPASLPSPRRAAPRPADEAAAPDVAESDPSLGPATAVDARRPGNTFAFRGIRVAVAETYRTPQGTALGVDFTPEAAEPARREAASAAPDRSPGPEIAAPGAATADEAPRSAGSGAPAPPPGTSPSASPAPAGGGFTEEEENFRLKWGWEAFDEAQREAVREAGRRPGN